MTDPAVPVPEWIDEIADDFEAAWRGLKPPRLEDFLGEESGERRAALLAELLKVDLAYRAKISSVSPATLDALAGAGLSTLQPLDPALLSAPPSHPAISGYEILAEIGRGGMGVVYQARQLRPRRVVALKMIRAGACASAKELARFRAEAEAAARLQHPNIVPIYEVGELAAQPYFSMEYVAGGALDKHLAGQPQPFRLAAQLVETLARAVHFAHQKGVVHRDLKPANILIQRNEEGKMTDEKNPADADFIPDPSSFLFPKITDFGLAKRLEEVGQTESGDILGTPSYMAPEQASGHSREIGPLADVYSLGAILYEMLAGRPPFRGQSRLDTLEQVRTQEPVSPRHLQPKVPRDLETICMKALAKDPNRRYATAAALADDLHRFLDGRPIEARPVGRAEKLWRWCRRNPALAGLWAATTAVLLTAILGLAAGLIIVNREKDQTALALAAEAKRRQQARQALDMLSSEIIDSWLFKQTELLPEHRAFLEKALAYYEEFTADTGRDEQARAGVAAAHLRIGNIRRELGQTAGAETAYARSRDLYASLVADFSTEPKYRFSLARSQNNLGVLLADTGRRQEAEKAHRNALAIRLQLATDSPSESEYQKDLASSHLNLGVLLSNAGCLPEAEEAYRAARALQERLVADFPAVAAYRRELANSDNNLGFLLASTGRPQQAERAYRDALALYQPLTAEFAQVAAYRKELATTQTNLGNLLADTGRAQEAKRAYRDALAIKQRLADDFPTVTAYRRSLATSHNNFGTFLEVTDRAEGAERAYREAAALQQRLVAESPAEPAYRLQLASSHNNLAALLARTGRPQEAEQSYRAALNLQEQLITEFPAVPQYRQDLARSHLNLGVLLQDTDRPQEAECCYRDAVAIRQQLAAEFPSVPDYRAGLANACINLGNLLTDTGRPHEGELALHDAQALYQQLATEFPAMAEYQHMLAVAMHGLARVLHDRKELRPARELLEQALPHHQAALRAYPRNPDYREGFRDNRIKLALILKDLADHPLAVETVEQVVEDPFDAIKDTYDAARVLSGCAQLAAKDSQLSLAKREEQARTYVDRAMELLRRAVQKGYKDAATLKKEADLEPLRSREDFRKLLADVEASAKSGAK
jgi:serine/threonine protein kinase